MEVVGLCTIGVEGGTDVGIGMDIIAGDFIRVEGIGEAIDNFGVTYTMDIVSYDSISGSPNNGGGARCESPTETISSSVDITVTEDDCEVNCVCKSDLLSGGSLGLYGISPKRSSHCT